MLATAAVAAAATLVTTLVASCSSAQLDNYIWPARRLAACDASLAIKLHQTVKLDRGGGQQQLRATHLPKVASSCGSLRLHG